MSIQDPMRFFARVTIEFTAPFLIASGEQSLELDAMPVVDAHGLPGLPGSSLAGLLRHAYTAEFGEDAAAHLFGSAPRQGGRDEGSGSPLWVTWGHIHSAKDVPVDGPVDGSGTGRVEDGWNDPVLNQAFSPQVRDHVRIGHTGAAEDQGKFDETVVAAGHRFTFDLLLEGEHGDEPDFQWLLRLLASGRLRIGRAGRRGLGTFKLVRLLYRAFDLREVRQAQAFAAQPNRLDQGCPELAPLTVQPLAADQTWCTLCLQLEPQECWSFNGTEAWLLASESVESTPDLNPYQDVRVKWSGEKAGDRGSLGEPCLVIPGSSVKGVLSHRVAFHYNRLMGRFADRAPEGVDPKHWARQCSGERNEAVRELFGYMSESSGGTSKGRAGRVFIDDIWLQEAHGDCLVRILHNSLDRFTGGTRAGVLFEERVIHRGPAIEILIHVVGFEELPGDVRSAFLAAVRDLAAGRLPLGAGASRGHGIFRSTEPIEKVLARLEA